MNTLGILGSAIFIIVGISFLLFPRTIRRYDQQLTRLVKDEEDYKTILIIYGAFFILIGIFIGVASFFGLLQ